MAFDPFVAIRFTPYHAARAGWADDLGRVFGVLGFRTRNPTALEFVAAVRDWQLARPPLVGDGLLGEQTWAELLPLVQEYSGPVPAGTHPDWMSLAEPGSNGHVPMFADPAAGGAEDAALQAALREWRRVGGSPDIPHVAIPVGGEFAAEAARESMPALATGGLCGVLRPGQVWPGLAGTRGVVAVTAAGSVVFVTDGGQAYYQTAAAWNADYLAGVYAGVVRRLSPLG